MTLIIEGDDSTEDAIEALTDTVETLAETIEEMATDDTPDVVVVESETDSHVPDILLGTVIERVNALEERMTLVEQTADVALNVAEVAIEEAATPVEVADEPVNEPEPDTPPETWKTRFHKFWYGDT